TVISPTGTGRYTWAMVNDNRCAPANNSAPIAAAESILTPAEPVRRRANCGAARAMKPIGPAAAVTRATVATPVTISPSRAGVGRVPRVTAASSPSSRRCSAGAKHTAATTISLAMVSEGHIVDHDTRLIDPAPQNPTVIASSISARVIRYALI